ncbi:MAG: TonB family protein [Selenomonas sp.]|nr:TonB family protein [Selenomonas sp.]
MAAMDQHPLHLPPARTRSRKMEELKAWGVSLAVHAAIFCVLAATGFFLLVREQPPQAADDVVDITMLAGGGNAGGAPPSTSGAPSAPPTAAAAPVIALPAETALPEIAETYTKDPERQQEYRQEHHAETPAAPAAPSPASGLQESAGAGAGSGSAGSGTGMGDGPGTGSGTGDGASTGEGAGSGAGTGEGAGSASAEPPAPVDAGAYCTYRAVPSYPASMVRAGAEGSVTILITVSPESSITDVSVVSSSGYPALDAAAVAAGWSCRFSMNGHPGRYRTTYRFELQDAGDDW